MGLRDGETDKDLLARYRDGQLDALEQLVENYRRSLFGFILNMTGGHEDAEEIFQEVWLRVIRKIHIYRQKNFLGWLVRVAHNIIIDRARRRKPDFSLDEEREAGRSLLEIIPGNDPGPLSKLEASELKQNIAKAVASLPKDQKEVFVMRVQTDLSFKEIAGIQKVSINTALARMQYAITKLRTMLKEDYEELGNPASGGASLKFTTLLAWLET